MNRAVIWIVAVMSVLLCGARAEFAVHDGDTVVFLGDSITAARDYGKIIENYTLLRFPDRKVRFLNAGRGGETAKGVLARLDKDVFAKGATLLTVAYGINDISWGVKADEEHRQAYLKSIGEIVDRCRQHGVRVFICSAAITAEDPSTAEKGYLCKMCNDGLSLAREKGAGAIDVQGTMREIQRRMWDANAKQPDKTKHLRMHVDDGVHLNDLGQMAMAYAILKGLGAPAIVSSADIDAGTGAVVSVDQCQISHLKTLDHGISFTRSDNRLPLNLGPLWLLQTFHIPVQDELNQYRLVVTNLPKGDYELVVGGKVVGNWPAASFAEGLNIASVTTNGWETGGIWDAQGHALKVLTDSRDQLAYARRLMAESLKAHPRESALDAKANTIEKQMVELQRQLARPVPIEFVIRKTDKPTESSK